MLHYRRWSKREEDLSLPKRWSLNFGAWILTSSGSEFLCVDGCIWGGGEGGRESVGAGSEGLGFPGGFREGRGFVFFFFQLCPNAAAVASSSSSARWRAERWQRRPACGGWAVAATGASDAIGLAAWLSLLIIAVSLLLACLKRRKGWER